MSGSAAPKNVPRKQKHKEMLTPNTAESFAVMATGSLVVRVQPFEPDGRPGEPCIVKRSAKCRGRFLRHVDQSHDARASLAVWVVSMWVVLSFVLYNERLCLATQWHASGPMLLWMHILAHSVAILEQ
eukprot:3576238-Amphidinium_carterae.1